MKKEWDFFVDELLSHAATEFRHTKTYELLEEKLEQMERDCNTMLTEDERAFVEECFELLYEASGQQEEHAYRCGMRDGITILKHLGVLA